MASPGAPPLWYRGAGEGPHLNSSSPQFENPAPPLPLIRFRLSLCLLVPFRAAQRMCRSNFRGTCFWPEMPHVGSLQEHASQRPGASACRRFLILGC